MTTFRVCLLFAMVLSQSCIASDPMLINSEKILEVVKEKNREDIASTILLLRKQRDELGRSIVLILKDRNVDPLTLQRAVEISAIFRLKEAIPYLVERIGLKNNYFTKGKTFSGVYPCAGALIEIGHDATEQIIKNVILSDERDESDMRVAVKTIAEIHGIEFLESVLKFYAEKHKKRLPEKVVAYVSDLKQKAVQNEVP